MAWCPGKCSVQNSSPNACARSTVKPLSVRVPWVKADDIVVAFHIFPFLVFPIAEIGSHTGNGKILARRSSAWQCDSPPSSISRPFSSRVGFMVNSSCSKVRYCFGCAIVGIFRADMFECCQQRHPPFCKTSNFKAARSEMAARTSPDKRVVGLCRTRSAARAI